MNDDLFHPSKIDLFHDGEFVDVTLVNDPTLADLSATLDSIVETLQRIEADLAEIKSEPQQ